jgi:hypothetical protein
MITFREFFNQRASEVGGMTYEETLQEYLEECALITHLTRKTFSCSEWKNREGVSN